MVATCSNKCIAAGGRIMPQLWHVGLMLQAGEVLTPDGVGPSGLAKPGQQVAAPMSQQDIDQVVQAYGQAAAIGREARLRWARDSRSARLSDRPVLLGGHQPAYGSLWRRPRTHPIRGGGDRGNSQERVAGFPGRAALLAMEAAGLLRAAGSDACRVGAIPRATDGRWSGHVSLLHPPLR